MLRYILTIALGVIAAAWMMGCAPHARIDQNWGRSYETARYNQILNPEAEKNLEPVEGIEGVMAEKIIMDRIEGDRSTSPDPSADAAAGKK
jgi:hypothetical protein